ncbi:MAG: type I restriction endonuclease subunit R [Bacteroidia bacterium]|nr:MAG: type I restriction endonuclease subunit R [Bacteroidia bacterium]
MSNSFIEADLEQAALSWMEELGYNILPANDISPNGAYPERKNFNDVLLNDRLQFALERINPELSHDAIIDALHQISIPQSPSLIRNNQMFHKMLTDGIDVSIRQDNGSFKTEKVKIFDFQNPQNNDWVVTSQFTVIENNVEKRPDLVVIVNGLPMVVIELKSSSDENVGISEAFNQIQTYKNKIPSLFTYNAFIIISDGINARIGTLTSDEDRFMMWRTIDGNDIAPLSIPQLEVMIRGSLNHAIFLDLIKNFTLFQTDGNNVYKILAGYHQYHAVNKALRSTIDATSLSGNKKAGVVWHTQGSGKSLSMVFYAGLLVAAKELSNPTVVIITDRNDLDDQLFTTFSNSRDLLRQTPVQAKDRSDLRKLLNREAGGVIFTTIHKFTPEANGDTQMSILTSRSNVIVIADEAHRSQYGFAAKVQNATRDVDNHAVDVKYGYAKYMRDSLPNASYIGFTGTPIELTDKNTRAVFGDYIDIYDMTRSVEDGTTVKIYYESRIAKLDLPDAVADLIDQEYDEITEFQEDNQKEQLKSKWSRLEAIVGSDSRIKLVAQDIVDHFEKRQAAQETSIGKAMIVAMSRRIAIGLYEAIIELRPQWHSDDLNKGVIKVVMTGSSSDNSSWQPFIGTKKTRDVLAKRMKDNDDSLKIVIVRDMWLTGFDVPSMNTMYIDKPMSGHNLMQAIARVNRVFKDKQGGLVVDYIGIAEHLRNALSAYTKQDREITGVDTGLAAQIMLEKIDLIRELLHGHDYSKFFGNNGLPANPQDRMYAIVATIDFIIGLREERKKDYLKLVSELSKAYSLCATMPDAEKLSMEVGFYKGVKAGIIKLIPEENKKKTASQLDTQINQLISKSITSDEVIDILGAVELNKPNIAILSDEVLEEIRGMKQQNVAVELLNKLLTGKVKSFAKNNLVQSKKFSEKLYASLKKYQNRAIETTQVIMELIELAKQINYAHKRGHDMGLTDDELAFYDALAESESAREVMQDEILQLIAKDLTKTIKANMSVDWHVRESVQANMRMEIRRLLKKYGYPPDKSDAAIVSVMEQAKEMCNNQTT